MNQSASIPRLAVGLLCLLHAAVLGTAAALLPWPLVTVFSLLLGAVAVLHLLTAALCLLGARSRALLFRLTALLSLGTFGYLSYAALGSGLYVNRLYDGVGTAIGLAALAAWAALALFFVPISAWGLAATGGLWPRASHAGKQKKNLVVTLTLLLVAFGLASFASSAQGSRPAAIRGADLVAESERALAGLLPSAPRKRRDQTFTASPAECPTAPATYQGATVFVTRQVARPGPDGTQISCLQASTLTEALLASRKLLEESWIDGEALIDIVTATRALRDHDPVLDPILVRPGTEGICSDKTCLSSWQLFALDAFTEAGNVKALQAELGTTASALRRHLGQPGESYLGLSALQTQTLLLRETGALEPLRHLRGASRPLETEELRSAVDDAVGYILENQEGDGRYRYQVQPFTGEISFSGFSVPRQAGTTLALCEAAAGSPRAVLSARKSLTMLADLEQSHGELGGIVYPKGAKRRASLGNTALSTIALLGCRPITGKRHDVSIGRLINALLAMQRPDGGFAPSFDPQSGEVQAGKDPLYAGGQAVMALVLMEKEGFAELPGLRAAIDRAMNYYAGPYWDIPLRDFFYLEENWHCLAAKAALQTHRHNGYERFCIDYMTMKSRFIERPGSGIDEDLVGAYAFGHVFPPHHTATAGFGEGLAAAIAIKRERGESTVNDEVTMRLVLDYLLRHQWRDDNCATCTTRARIVGAFSENVASPQIRIDFVQHAMAGMFHGSVVLGLLAQVNSAP